MTVGKSIPKLLPRPVTAIVNSAKNQSEFPAITVTYSKAREKSRIQSMIDFGFASHWLKTSSEIFKPIITNCEEIASVITFDRHLKTALQ